MPWDKIPSVELQSSHFTSRVSASNTTTRSNWEVTKSAAAWHSSSSACSTEIKRKRGPALQLPTSLHYLLSQNWSLLPSKPTKLPVYVNLQLFHTRGIPFNSIRGLSNHRISAVHSEIHQPSEYICSGLHHQQSFSSNLQTRSSRSCHTSKSKNDNSPNSDIDNTSAAWFNQLMVIRKIENIITNLCNNRITVNLQSGISTFEA